MVQFFELPEEMHRIILAPFSLNQLIHLRAVSRQMKALIECLLVRQQTLYIFGSQKDAYEVIFNLNIHADYATNALFNFTKFNCIILSSRRLPAAIRYDGNTTNEERIFSADGGRFLANLFPMLQNFMFLSNEEFISTPRFDLNILRNWTSTLQTLSLHLAFVDNFHDTERVNTINVLWSNVARMTSLKRLHLFDLANTLVPRLAILYRLEELALDGSLVDNDKQTLRQVGPSLTSLKVRHLPKVRASLRSPFAKIAHNLTHLTVLNGRLDDDFFLTVPYFEALTHLDISSMDHLSRSFAQIMTTLEHLPQLQSLAIEIQALNDDKSVYGDHQSLMPFNFTPLPTLRELHLTDFWNVVGDFSKWRALAYAFPQLTKLKLTYCIDDIYNRARIIAMMRRFFGLQVKLQFFKWLSNEEKLALIFE